MSPRLRRFVLLAFATTSFGAVALFADGCGSDSATPGGTTSEDGGGGTDGTTNKDGATGSEAATTDGGADAPADSPATGTGETCIGFAKGQPCGDGGLPEYGYVCFNGSPPGFNGCVQASKTAFGETYCCPENKCVAQPDQDKKECKAAATPHRYQCPPDGMGGSVAPPAGCADGGSGGSAVERFYCCP